MNDTARPSRSTTREVDGVGLLGPRHRAEVVAPALGVDAGGEFVGECVGQQEIDRHVGLGRIGDIGVAHRVGKPRRLHLHVVAAGGKRFGAARGDPLQDVEENERGDAVAVGRDLGDVEAAEVGGDRRHPVAAMGGEIVEPCGCRRGAQFRHHVGGDGATVECGGAAGGDRLQAFPPGTGNRTTVPSAGDSPRDQQVLATSPHRAAAGRSRAASRQRPAGAPESRPAANWIAGCSASPRPRRP